MIFEPCLAYQFFPPRPNALLTRLLQPYLRYRVLPHVLSVRSLAIENADRVRQINRSQDSMVLTANHPANSDGWTIVRALHLAGIRTHYATAYMNLIANRKSVILALRAIGAYSIDPFDFDANSFSQSMAVLTQDDPRRALLLFPEGAIYQQNDLVDRFKDGASYLAVKAARELLKRKSGRRVWMAPVALKFTHMTDARGELESAVDQLQRHLGLARTSLGDAPTQVLAALGVAAVNHTIHRLALSDVPMMDSPRQLQRTLHAAMASLDRKLGIDSQGEKSDFNRMMSLRRQVQALALAGENRTRLDALHEEINFITRLDGYAPDYVCSRPTLDRVSELVQKIYEDLHNQRLFLKAPAQAVVRFCDPLDATACFERGTIKQAIHDLTADTQAATQSAVDAINAANPHPGGRLWHELSQPSVRRSCPPTAITEPA